MKISMEIPAGRKASEQMWQDGYRDGEMERHPSTTDDLYVSGWLTGYSGTNQCLEKDAVAAFKKAAGLED